MVLTIYGNIGAIMEDIKALGTLVDQTKIANLKLWALALLVAQAKFASSQYTPGSIESLVNEVQNAKRGLEVELCVHRGLLPADAVKLVGGNSYNGWAQDVRSMGMVLLANWEVVGPAIGGDAKRIDAAIAKADELTAAVAKNAELKDRQIDAGQLRNATFALCIQAVRETERSVNFTRFHKGDANEICPSVFNFASGSRSRKSDDGKGQDGAIDLGPLVEQSFDAASAAASAPTQSVNPNVPSRPIAPSRSTDK